MHLTLKPLEIALPLPVRTYDIDFAGVVSNIVYVRWLEDLRLEMLARYFPEALQKGIVPVIVQTKVDYQQPIRLGDRPIGKMWVKTLETVRWTVQAEIIVNHKVAAVGEQVGIFINAQTQRPMRMPESLKQQYHSTLATTA
jgi:acyl-CoA thioester hydrolase